MKCEADAEIDREPRQIEQRRGPGAADIAAHPIEVTQGLDAIAGDLGAQRQTNERRVNFGADRLVEAVADADQHPCPDHVENAMEQEQRGYQE
jgi:hypothetical protein